MVGPQKHIAILGSTGSIGVQALEVIAANPQVFKAEVLTAQQNAELLIEQALAFGPSCVVIGDVQAYPKVKEALAPKGIRVLQGPSGLEEAVELPSVNVVLTALVGYAGLLPTMKAIGAGKDIALANKETLVVAGDLIMPYAKAQGVSILPVDSEHSAIFQCLVGEPEKALEKIILTASGGPFRGYSRADLAKVSRAQALKHPNWSMGAKITIDSASLMNKGLEVIEAKWLFDLEAKQIEVVVHPQSILHSLVQFCDGSMKAQMGLPDMKLPIQYALTYPDRLQSQFPRFDFSQYPQLTFQAPDLETFQNLNLAFQALEKGGNAACMLNAANEIAVAAFLEEKIGFLEMAELNAFCMDRGTFLSKPTLEDYIHTNNETRALAQTWVQQAQKRTPWKD